MCAELVRTGSQFRDLFQEIVSRGRLMNPVPVDIKKAIILNLILDVMSVFSSGSFE